MLFMDATRERPADGLMLTAAISGCVAPHPNSNLNPNPNPNTNPHPHTYSNPNPNTNPNLNPNSSPILKAPVRPATKRYVKKGFLEFLHHVYFDVKARTRAGIG